MLLTTKNVHVFDKEQHKLVGLMCFHAARLYNVALYNARQHFFAEHCLLSYNDNYHKSRKNENYALLQTDVGQPAIKKATTDMQSFFAKLASDKHKQKCGLPRYKPKEGMATLEINGTRIRLRDGFALIGFSKGFKQEYKPTCKTLKIPIPKHLLHIEKFQQVRIKPRFGGKEFDVEFVYAIEPVKSDVCDKKYLGIDLGVDNLMTCFESPTGASYIIDGREIKSENQWYNKQKAKLQSIYDKQETKHSTKRMRRLSRRREHQMDDLFNRAAQYIVLRCIEKGIGRIVVGMSDGIKQKINLGKRNNQNFVSIAFEKLKRKLRSKCEQCGLKYDEENESYTSKCSFLDGEEVRKHEVYAGKRVHRGLFRASDGRLVNADANAAANILAKYVASKGEECFLERSVACRGLVNGPVRIRRKDLYAFRHCANQKAPS